MLADSCNKPNCYIINTLISLNFILLLFFLGNKFSNTSYIPVAICSV